MRPGILTAIYLLPFCLYLNVSGIPASDSLNIRKLPVNTAGINFNMLPGYSRYGNRYLILSNYNEDYLNISLNHSLQKYLHVNSDVNASILQNFYLLSSSYENEEPELTPGTKELLYGAWRSKLTGSKNQSDIERSVTEGVNFMITMGFDSFENDLMPFITSVMEEHQIVNYDNSRTKAFGKGSRGTVTSLDILNALGSLDTEQNYGVCRDVHETGREILKTMAETWYGHYYPENNIDFDDYIFLQSWMTDRSHHVTISFIDPIQTSRVFELDWGRVIQKNNIRGYDNGRLYGNTYRIWKFDKRKQMSVPVDFRRTQFGKILDESILTDSEYRQLNGIHDKELFSDISFSGNLGNSGNLVLSLGSYYPGRGYFLAGWYAETKKTKINVFLSHSSLFAVQAALHEDTEKKNLMYPQKSWTFAGSIMGIPRVISKFVTSEFRLTNNLTLDAYFNQQFDIFLTGNLFYQDNTSDRRELTGSGDGNLSFSNGINIKYNHGANAFSTLSFQARSCLLPKDIRLFTPNLSTLIPSLRFITPAFDAIATGKVIINSETNITAESIFEFTSLGGVLWSGKASASTRVGSLGLTASVGATDQIKGLEYYWYPASYSHARLRIEYSSNFLEIGLLKYPESRLSLNFAFSRSLF
jgi:hypothetical protein